ncbi:MAG: hypothetical protein Kow001_01970 [Acidobacteriota bacterium]
MNDPNGLVYLDGEYHLFFQYNPFGEHWGHMSWGHAVSEDLAHWRHLRPALLEEDGVMIFSGSAVVDRENSSGLGSAGEPLLVTLYTGHHTARPLQTQNLAYSKDRGRSWVKYRGNPVLDVGRKDFRDPKVLWHGPTGRWVMVVAVPVERKVSFYASRNLIEWHHVSDFGPAGSTEGIWECPDLFELPVEGTADSRWVLIVSVGDHGPAGGSGCQYFVGTFDGVRFTAESMGTGHPDAGTGEDALAGTGRDGPKGTGRSVPLGTGHGGLGTGKQGTGRTGEPGTGRIPWAGTAQSVPVGTGQFSVVGTRDAETPGTGTAEPTGTGDGGPVGTGQFSWVGTGGTDTAGTGLGEPTGTGHGRLGTGKPGTGQVASLGAGDAAPVGTGQAVWAGTGRGESPGAPSGAAAGSGEMTLTGTGQTALVEPEHTDTAGTGRGQSLGTGQSVLLGTGHGGVGTGETVWAAKTVWAATGQSVLGTGHRQPATTQEKLPGTGESAPAGTGHTRVVGTGQTGSGQIPDGRTELEQSEGVAQWVDYGPDFYAAVSWSNAPQAEGRRPWIGWMNNWRYAESLPTRPWRGAMSVPRELALRRVGTQLLLVQRPSPSLQQLRQSHRRIELEQVVSRLSLRPSGSPDLRTYELDAVLEPAADAAFELLFAKGSGEVTVLRVDVPSGYLSLDRTRSGQAGFHPDFPGSYRAPFRLRDGRLRLLALVDRSSVEIFVNDGEQVITSLIFPDPSSSGLELEVHRGRLETLQVDLWDLASVWTQPPAR